MTLSNKTDCISRRKFLNYMAALSASASTPGLALAQSTLQLKKVNQATVFSVNETIALSIDEQKIADEIVNEVKHQFAVAIANPDADYAQPFARIAKKLTTTTFIDRESNSRAKAEAMIMASESEQQKEFGRFRTANVSTYQQTMLSDQYQPTAMLRKINKSNLVSARSSSPAASYISAKPERKKLNLKKLKVDRYNELTLYFRKMRSLEETNEVGADEVRMRTASYLPNGNRVDGAETLVSSDFDKGEVVDFTKMLYNGKPSPLGRPIARINLGDVHGVKWPYSYSFLSILAEEDAGGFGDMVKEIWNSIDQRVKDYAFAAAGAAIGAAIGSIWPGFGTAIGAIVGAILGKLAEWFIQIFDNPDDYIDEMTLDLHLATNAKSYFQDVWGGPASPNFDFTFRGDGGKFRGNFMFGVS